jgi:hypothetical protein
MPAAKAFGGKRTMSPRERSELFVNRRNKQQILSFVQVDTVELLTALNVAMSAGATVSFAPAQGGIGITLRVYRGDYADTEFAGSVEELNELLGIIIDGMGSTSEDARKATQLELKHRG